MKKITFIKVHNEKHSKAVQDLLFEMGYGWDGGRVFKHKYSDKPAVGFGESIRKSIYFTEGHDIDQALKDSPVITLDDLYKELSDEETVDTNDLNW